MCDSVKLFPTLLNFLINPMASSFTQYDYVISVLPIVAHGHAHATVNKQLPQTSTADMRTFKQKTGKFFKNVGRVLRGKRPLPHIEVLRGPWPIAAAEFTGHASRELEEWYNSLVEDSKRFILYAEGCVRLDPFVREFLAGCDGGEESGSSPAPAGENADERAEQMDALLPRPSSVLTGNIDTLDRESRAATAGEVSMSDELDVSVPSEATDEIAPEQPDETDNAVANQVQSTLFSQFGAAAPSEAETTTADKPNAAIPNDAPLPAQEQPKCTQRNPAPPPCPAEYRDWLLRRPDAPPTVDTLTELLEGLLAGLETKNGTPHHTETAERLSKSRFSRGHGKERWVLRLITKIYFESHAAVRVVAVVPRPHVIRAWIETEDEWLGYFEALDASVVPVSAGNQPKRAAKRWQRPRWIAGA